MANSRHYYKGQQIEEPRNWQALQVEMNWTNAKTEATIKFDSLEFVGDTAIKIIQDLKDNGYFEGQPYRIEAGEIADPAYTFDGYLDATDNPVLKGDCEIQLALKQKHGRDWLEAAAKSFSYRYLADPAYTGRGSITSADYLGVPYVINFFDGVELLILSISTFMLTKELVESIQSIAQQTTDLINGVTPIQGTAGPIPVVGFDLGDIIGAIINLAVTVAYTIGVTFALVKLIEQIIEQLAPKKRIHLGMSIKSLFKKGCEYLGLELKSTLLDALDSGQQWVMLPQKGHRGGEPPTGTDAGGWIETGHPTTKDGIDNLGDAIQIYGDMFNADYIVSDGVFEFERRDFWRNQSTYTIPNTFTNQDTKQNESTKNTGEVISSYEILWADDLQDQNTLDNQNGRSFQVITTPNTVNDPDLVNIKGSKTVSIPISMAIRKDNLTEIEEVLKVFLQAADFLSGQLDSPNSFAAQFSARIGTMHLSSHFISRPKMVVMSGGKLAVGQREILDSRQLWNNYHFIESFVTIDGINNQQVIIEEQKIDFCPKDFVTLSKNNYVQTSTGQQAEVTNLTWNVEENSAVISYRVFEVYDNNLKLIFQTI